MDYSGIIPGSPCWSSGWIIAQLQFMLGDPILQSQTEGLRLRVRHPSTGRASHSWSPVASMLLEGPLSFGGWGPHWGDSHILSFSALWRGPIPSVRIPALGTARVGGGHWLAMSRAQSRLGGLEVLRQDGIETEVWVLPLQDWPGQLMPEAFGGLAWAPPPATPQTPPRPGSASDFRSLAASKNMLFFLH